MPKNALEHLTIIEVCDTVSGSMGCKILADFGATVIKIEPPGTGSRLRHSPPFFKGDPGVSTPFLFYNTNKLGVTLDIRAETGKKIFLELVATADALVVDFPAGTLDEMGLSHEALQAANPSLILASVTPFGQFGPYRDFKAKELTIAQCGGIGNMLPYFATNMSRSMVKPGGKALSGVTGMVVALSVLGAAFRRTAQGKGCCIDISQQDSQLLVEGLGLIFGDCYNLKFSRQRHTPMARGFREPVKCRDGYFMICLNTEDREWKRLVDLIDEPALKREELLSSLTRHDLWDDEIKGVIEAWARKFKKEELFHICQKAGISGTPVRTSQELFDNEQMRFRGFFESVDHPATGPKDYPFAPVRYSDMPDFTPRPAPSIGEHNRQVIGERLGYGKAEMDAFKASKIM